MSKISDIVLFPLRCCFPNSSHIIFFSVTPLANDRFDAVRVHLNGGQLLDIGCGDNRLVKEYQQQGGEGVGLDIAPNPDADIEVSHSKVLPFDNDSFDYVTIIAAINHISTRQQTLQEAYRCLKPDGIIILTNLSPLVGTVGHLLWHFLGNDPDANRRGGIHEEEAYGLRNCYVRQILQDSGFSNIRHRRFSFGLNNIFIGSKKK